MGRESAIEKEGERERELIITPLKVRQSHSAAAAAVFPERFRSESIDMDKIHGINRHG